jgi:two-component system, OmpR family, phosphate regulon response regulator PhoB
MDAEGHFSNAAGALLVGALHPQPMSRTALIVEDEPDLAGLIALQLEGGQWTSRIALTCSEARSQLHVAVPQLIVLDRMLPDGSGEQFCKELRHEPRTQKTIIVMLTARGEEVDRISGFEAGVDDYIVKPFSGRELVLRIEAICRRLGVAAETKIPLLEVGPLAMDVAEHRAFVNGVETALTALEFQILQFLLERGGRVCTRAQLIREIWGNTTDVQSRTLDMHVMRLREKLKAEARLLETIRGVGYRISDKDTL